MLPTAAHPAACCCCRSVFGCEGQEVGGGQEPAPGVHLELLLQQLALQGSQQQALLAQQASRVCPAPASRPLLRTHEGRIQLWRIAAFAAIGSGSPPSCLTTRCLPVCVRCCHAAPAGAL